MSSLKIAFCFSGMIRDLKKTEYFWKQIFDNHNCDIYGHFWDVSDRSEEDNLSNFEKYFHPKKVELENFDTFKESTLDIMMKNIKVPSSLDTNLVNFLNKGTIISQYYKVYRSYQLSLCENYDVIVRCRTDFYPESSIIFQKNDCINLPSGGLIYVPGWKNSAANYDVFAYGNRKTMNYFSSLFLYTMSYIKTGYYFFPAEYFLKAHLAQKDIILKEIPHKFFNPNGLFFNTLSPLCDVEIPLMSTLEDPDPTFTFYNRYVQI
jgi:hypothetical protein